MLVPLVIPQCWTPRAAMVPEDFLCSTFTLSMKSLSQVKDGGLPKCPSWVYTLRLSQLLSWWIFQIIIENETSTNWKKIIVFFVYYTPSRQQLFGLKCQTLGQVCGVVVSSSHIQVPGLQSWLCSWIMLLWVTLTPVPGDQDWLLIPGFSLDQPLLLWALEWTSRWRTACFCLSNK